MKRIFTTLTLLFAVAFASAQTADLIVLKSGQTLSVFNVELGESNVFYTEGPTADAAMRKVARSNVFAVKIGDGELTQLGAPTAAKAPDRMDAPASAATSDSAPAVTMAVAASDNAEKCAAYTSREYSYTLSKRMEKYQGQLGSEAAIVFYRISDNSILSTPEIEIFFESGYWNDLKKQWTGLSVLSASDKSAKALYSVSDIEVRIGIRNKTDYPLYLDLSRCVHSSEIAGYRAYYDGTQAVESAGNSVHGGIGLGMVGLGIGSSSTATVVKNQASTLIIPPQSRVYLPIKKDLNQFDKKINEHYDIFSNVKEELPFTKTLPELRNYNRIRFTEADSPTTIKFSIVYSSDASFAQATMSNFKLYVSQLIPLRQIYEAFVVSDDHLSKFPDVDDQTLIGTILLIKKYKAN